MEANNVHEKDDFSARFSRDPQMIETVIEKQK